MNLPNKLTMLRMLLIPLFLLLYFIGYNGLWHGGYLCALLVFVAAAYTDHLDGAIARKRGLVTDFGKLMDPLADKILVMSAMICLLSAAQIHPIAVIVILSREFLVTSIRTVGAGKGIVIAADNWGKAKTVTQIIWLGMGLLMQWIRVPASLYWLTSTLKVTFFTLTLAVLTLTVISGVNYTWKNRGLFRDL